MSRHELRKTFGEDAELYDRVRPSYPTSLYDDLAALLGNPVRPRVLEIGCGTGQATTPMIRRGWSVKAVDLSPELAAVARNKLPELEVITAAFEDWPQRRGSTWPCVEPVHSTRILTMAIFAVQLRFTDPERRMQVRPAHREYLTTLREAGKLVAAGPFADQSGALLCYNVADEAELRDILAKDPYTSADVYEIAALNEWQPLFPFDKA